MELSTTARLSQALGREATFRWTGAPKTGILFRASDVYAIPFSLMWAGFAFFWEFQVASHPAATFFKLWGVPFVLAGLYMTLGRFVVDAYRRAHTAYAIGDSAAYIVRDGLSPRTLTVPAAALAPLELRKHADGSGTIVFGPRLARPYGSWDAWGRSGETAFEAIDHVDEAYRALSLIAGIDRTATASSSVTSWRP